GDPVPAVALIVGEGTVALWQVEPVERLRRELAARGIRDLRRDPRDLPPGGGPVVVLRADFVFDPTLVRAVAATLGLALLAADADEVVAANVARGAAAEVAEAMAAARLTAEAARRYGLEPKGPGEAAGAYRGALRKREAPYLLRTTAGLDAAERGALERRLFGGAYKGVTDAVTKYLWPEPAFWATQACVRLGITANMVTLASLLLVGAAFYWFAAGQYAVGLVAAWLMTFLDTVDGKLARVTVTHTKFGNVFDHGIDLVHPPFWYWA